MDLRDVRVKELLKIVDERNDLSRRRTKIKNKLYRLKDIRERLIYNDRYDQLAKQVSDAKVREKYLSVAQSLEDIRDALHKHRIWGNAHKHLKHLDDEIGSHLKWDQDQSKQALAKMRRRQDPPKKYMKMNRSELKLQILMLEKDYAEINLETALFTKRTRKRLSELKKELNVKAGRDGYYNRINYIETDGERIKRDEINQIVKDLEFDEIVLGAESVPE